MAEQIQDKMGEKLIAIGYTKAAKVYIIYRAEYTKIHEADQSLMKICEGLTFKPFAEANLEHESTSIDADTAIGAMLGCDPEDAKCFYSTYMLPPDITQVHHNGDTHTHDMDFYTLTGTCCQVDLIKLFRSGFPTDYSFLCEPSDIRSYAALAYIAIQANQSKVHGGRSVPNFDYAMAIGVAKTSRRVYLRAMIRYLHIKMEPSLEDTILLVDKIKHLLTEPITLGDVNNYREAFNS